MEAMPTVSSSVEKLPQIPHISLTQRHQTIRHPEKCSKPENDAICGLKHNSPLVFFLAVDRDVQHRRVPDASSLAKSLIAIRKQG
jgi:hypothetical protein